MSTSNASHAPYEALSQRLIEAVGRGLKPTALAEQFQAELAQLDGPTWLRWLADQGDRIPSPARRILRLLALSLQPIGTLPNTTDYEWAGGALKRLFQTNRPVAESWAFFSGAQRPAVIRDGWERSDDRLTMEQLTTSLPLVLGPHGMDPENAEHKYFFVKFLDPSDFPAFAYVGFKPEAITRLGLSPAGFRGYFEKLLWQDRQAVEAFADFVRPHIVTELQFQRLKHAYKRWAITQAKVNWDGSFETDQVAELAACAPSGQSPTVRQLLSAQQTVRSKLVGFLHRIDYERDQAILIQTPTLHAIAGLSIQAHPRMPGNFFPKDELWIYKPLTLPDGSTGWILVEPQRTFDKTESGADFFTPFAWQHGRLGFRKAITPEYLRSFVALLDMTPYPRAHYVRNAEAVALPGSRMAGGAQWYRTVEEPAWPFFIVRELRFSGPGTSTTELSHRSFTELHVTQGEVQIELSNGSQSLSTTVTPAQPLFLPASLPFSTITYRAHAPAELQFFTRA